MAEKKIKVRPGTLMPLQRAIEWQDGSLSVRDIVKREWEKLEVLANRFIWAILTDF